MLYRVGKLFVESFERYRPKTEQNKASNNKHHLVSQKMPHLTPRRGDAKNQYPSRNISFSYQRVIHVVAILL